MVVLLYSGIQKSSQRPQEVELIKYVEEQSFPEGLATETAGRENLSQNCTGKKTQQPVELSTPKLCNWCRAGRILV